MNRINKPIKISKKPIKDIGKGATLIQKIPDIKQKMANIKDSIVKLKYHRSNAKGPENKTVKNIIVTNNAKDAMLIL